MSRRDMWNKRMATLGKRGGALMPIGVFRGGVFEQQRCCLAGTREEVMQDLRQQAVAFEETVIGPPPQACMWVCV